MSLRSRGLSAGEANLGDACFSEDGDEGGEFGETHPGSSGTLGVMFFAHAVGTAKVALACDGNARVAYLPVKGVGKRGVAVQGTAAQLPEFQGSCLQKLLGKISLLWVVAN